MIGFQLSHQWRWVWPDITCLMLNLCLYLLSFFSFYSETPEPRSQNWLPLSDGDVTEAPVETDPPSLLSGGFRPTNGNHQVWLQLHAATAQTCIHCMLSWQRHLSAFYHWFLFVGWRQVDKGAHGPMMTWEEERVIWKPKTGVWWNDLI